ncbi:DEAD-box ATP-dependent RNA helicase CshA [Poriferisphaera corsica]|uniref:DEAD-box ATP-dependent RNA helicase CshA n=1 Tax=Poriferisphaera corsica TaxID=2528020 RepID=A0A517YRG6_9BACT|nr:DEAD/DEAH box helicase [Poriferisphaera corsica]QDU32828.1 DEAD-box ATP-dependent RNA helicase CshA [Poriferisphaera corsica]
MSEIFDTSNTFEDLGLRNSVLKGIEKMGFQHPTDIQALLIPAVLSGRDVIGQAKTGTGKTAAFGLPLLHMCEQGVPMQALILTPTRELAAQICSELDQLGEFTPIRSVSIIGGMSMRKQQQAIEEGVEIIVGTPGRVMDLYGRKQINFKNMKHVVLDEVDRMLDIGFRDDIRKILSNVRCEHQTVFVSATIDPEIERLSRSFMKNDAEKLSTVSGSLTVDMVDQKYYTVEGWDKRRLLMHILKHEDPETTVVFCKTKATVQKIADYLRGRKFDVREIHGDLRQKKRNSVMNSMREGKVQVLVASDLAARGLDVEHITHVLNYDLPEDPEIYVHRIGRTARAGRRGFAWSFVTPEQGQLLTNIEILTGAHIEKLEFDEGFKPGPVPKDVLEEREREEARQKRREQDTVRTGPRSLDGLSDDQLSAMFPGGKIPTGASKKKSGGRLRSKRRR